jgi:hypothetical protein
MISLDLASMRLLAVRARNRLNTVLFITIPSFFNRAFSLGRFGGDVKLVGCFSVVTSSLLLLQGRRT